MDELEVLKMGNPKLRQTCLPVLKEELLSNEFQQFLGQLTATMRGKNGVGIAAPQVGALKRVFLMEVDDNPRYPNQDSFPLLTAINPEIKVLSNETIESWEGCLSIPGIRGQLKRAKKIELNGWDHNGKAFKKILIGFPAIVAQHELDHLNGVLFIDRMNDLKTLAFKREFDLYWNP